MPTNDVGVRWAVTASWALRKINFVILYASISHLYISSIALNDGQHFSKVMLMESWKCVNVKISTLKNETNDVVFSYHMAAELGFCPEC